MGAPRKPATKKAAPLRKAHSHIKTSKPRKRRPEVDHLLGVKQSIQVHALDAEAMQKTFEKAPAAGEPIKDSLTLRLDVEAVKHEVITNLSPLEKAGADLMFALQDTEELVNDLPARLAVVLKKPSTEMFGHSDAIETGIPYVDAVNKQVTKLKRINTALRDLQSRIGV
jgi:hypothetical protein